MKILFLCKAGLQASQTGEGTQSRKTAEALRSLGHTVTKAFVSPHPFAATDETGSALDIEAIRTLAKQHDIVHLMPCNRRMAAFWRSLRCDVPAAASTVFWSGWERLAVTARSTTFGIARFRRMATYLRMMCPALQDFRGIDLFLPNTNAEGERVLSCFRHDRNALCFPVPNGFDIPPFPLGGLERPAFAPAGDYLVVPGIFALRKNQLSLIRALKEANLDIPVLFLGGVFNHPLDKAFFDRCRREATSSMHFAGFVPSSSREYWAALRHARCACLPSDCETPGISLLEAAFAGARPVVTQFGGTKEYYSFDGEYFHPCRNREIAEAIRRAWSRGRLMPEESALYSRFSWHSCARLTNQAYSLMM